MPNDTPLIAQERKDLMKFLNEGKFAVPPRKLNKNIIIASWNIQHFSNNKSARALRYIADICERFDIIAIQEVKTDLRGLSKLQDLLPGDYKILVCDPTGNYERFAFLYDTRTVTPTGLVCEIGFNVTGKEHTGYQLHRMPYCASFKAGRFDFTLVTAHIYYGSTKAGKDEREKEIDKLAEFIQKRSKTDPNKVFDPDFIVVGDFNIEKEGDRFFEALVSKGFQMPPNLNKIFTNFLQNKTYDKIAWVKRDSFAFKSCNTVPYGEVLFQDKSKKDRKKAISDHLPLWAEFEINRLSQQLDHIIND